jgi:molecular chaperone GrpE
MDGEERRPEERPEGGTPEAGGPEGESRVDEGGGPRAAEPPREESLEGTEDGAVAEAGDELVEEEIAAPEISPEAMEELEAEPEEEVEVAREEVAVLLAELDAARRERDEYLNDMRRMKADLENSRKRMERERERLVQSASEGLVREMLPVLDNLERALEAEGDVREGVRATRDQLLRVLEGEGLEIVPSDGEVFDPALHEAVMGQPSDEHEEGTVVRTFEKGYVLNGRPIRAAKVVVAS